MIEGERKVGPGIVEIPQEVVERDGFERKEELKDDVGEILRKRKRKRPLELREGSLRQANREVESLLL